MTTATATLLEPATTARRSARWTIAAREGWRILRHPAFLLCGALTLFLCWEANSAEAGWSTQRYWTAATITGAPLLLGTAIAAGWVLTREHGDGDWFPGAPVDAGLRAQARLLALLWPAAVGVVLAVGTWAVITVAGGITTGDLLSAAESGGRSGLGQAQLTPDLLTLACIPAGVLFVGATSYALASWSRVTGTVIVSFVTFVTTFVSWAFAPVFWITPLTLPAFEVMQPAGYDPASAPSGTVLLRPDEYRDGWGVYELVPAVGAAHLLFLLAGAGLWGALALRLAQRRDLPDAATTRLVRTLAIGGAVLVAVAIAAQILLVPDGADLLTG